LEEIYDQKGHKSLPSSGNFNSCSVFCSIINPIFHFSVELKFAKHAIHFEKYLTRDSRQFTFFKQYFTKSVGPGRFSAEKLKVILDDFPQKN